MSLDINVIRGILTVLLLIAFSGLCIWAWSRQRQAAFTEAANLPFADDAVSLQSGVMQNTPVHAKGEQHT